MFFALLQAQPPAIPDPTDLVQQLVALAKVHKWLPLTGLMVYCVVALSKQGWAGQFIAKIPQQLLPWEALAVGFLGTFGLEMFQGVQLAQALVDGFSGALPALIAILGHQTVVEHMRGGKEIVPKAPWAGGPPGGTNVVEREAAKLSDPPKPPASAFSKSGVRRILTACTLSLAVCAVTVTTGCSSILSNPVYVAEWLSQYVTLFIETAQTIWQTILPLLGSNSASANVAFTDAIVVLQQANSVLMDAAQAVAAGKVEDLASLIADVQKAVQSVMDVIAQFEQQAPGSIAATGSKMDALTHMAMSIKHWGPTP